MSLDYKELAKLLSNVEDAAEKYNVFATHFLETMAYACMAETKRRTPVDDGDLRNRWKVGKVQRRGNELFVLIYNPLRYASFVEDGHRQLNRFLPIKYLSRGSTKGRKLAKIIRGKYGAHTKGIQLKQKWIPGYFMARISINNIENRIPAEYEKAVIQFMKSLGVM